MLDVLIAALEQLEGDVGVTLGEVVKQPRQQVDGDAEEGADAHLTHLQIVEEGHLTLHLLIFLADLPDGREQGLALLGEADAETVPEEELDAQFFLQAGDDVADGGLGVAQDFGGLGEAAQVRGFQQDLIFFDTHGKHSLCCFLSSVPYLRGLVCLWVMKAFESGFQKPAFYKGASRRYTDGEKDNRARTISTRRHKEERRMEKTGNNKKTP